MFGKECRAVPLAVQCGLSEGASGSEKPMPTKCVTMKLIYVELNGLFQMDRR
jgi:hypothetical protein